MSTLRIVVLFLILVVGLLVVVLVTTGLHELVAGAIGFFVGVLVARLGPPLWRWAHRGNR